jgi:adhesin/invasin
MIAGLSRSRIWGFLAVLSVLTVACDSIALLAPAGSTITLTTFDTTLPLNGTTNIIAQVIEPAGTPPNEGTVVTFTTSLGSTVPIEAETDKGGRALVRFNAGTRSGVATIAALSGGVATTAEGALKIAVGAAAATGISMSAAPSTVSAGGRSVVSASVTDTGGNLVPGVPVAFSTDNGSLIPPNATTNENGVASTTLTTTKTAMVKATAGAATVNGTTTTPAPSATITVTVDPLPTASITTTGNAQVGTATTFTVTAQAGPGSTAGIDSVSVSFGDGASASLGNASGSNFQVQHVYQTGGSFTATVNVVDTNGGRASASTVVVVTGSNVIGVNVTSSQSTNTATMITTVTFTVTVSPASVAVTNYAWEFGDGTFANTTGNQVQHPYAAGSGQKIVRVTVTTTIPGQTGMSTITISP